MSRKCLTFQQGHVKVVVMSITEILNGNIFDSNAEALVNPVNCEGVLGAGLALQFKKRFGKQCSIYTGQCKDGLLNPGKVLVTGTVDDTQNVIHFPTKNLWRNPSQLSYIEVGLVNLILNMRAFGIRSVAIPMLGCGLGGLDWVDVKPLIVDAFAFYPDLEVELYVS